MKIVKRFVLFSFALLSNLVSASDQVVTFDGYLESVMRNNQLFESLKLAEESAEQKRVASDFDLSPMLTASIRQLDDRKLQPFGAAAVLDRTKVFDYQFGIAKKWSTGTTTQLSASLADQTLRFGNPTINQFSDIPIVTSQLGLSLQQSLWKDGFGHLVSIRQEREDQALKMARLSRKLNEAQVLIKAEQAFWDYVYHKEEVRQRKDSLDRAKKIEGWFKNRLNNGLSEDSDLIGSQSLVALRELQLAMAEDSLIAVSRDVKQSLQLPLDSDLPPFTTNLNPQSHPLYAKVRSKEILTLVRLDYLLTKMEADLKSKVVSEVKEQLKPDLLLEAKYNTNSIQNNTADSLAGITDMSRPTQAIGLKLAWAFGGDAKSAQIKSAQYERQSAEIKAARLKLESDYLMHELYRRYQELDKKIRIAENAARLQSLKAKAEQSKLTKGRAVTSQVIQAEQDASESELTLIKLKAEQLKLLSQFRLFYKEE
jgi:outer membrane protein TolC